MGSLRSLKKNWEGFAQSDPLWAVCSDPTKENQEWNISDFFSTGENEIRTVLRYIQLLGLSVDTKGPALDFGCGVGRLTQAMSRYFDSCYGVDLSPTMIKLANDFNNYPLKCHYLVNDSEYISQFQNDYFSFIYTNIVLQHIEPKYVEVYLKEFVRILKPCGVLVFQIPDRHKHKESGIQKFKYMRIIPRLRIRKRLKRILGRGYWMELHHIPEMNIRNTIQSTGAKVQDVRMTNSFDDGFNGSLRYLEDGRRYGIVSKQYCVIKGK